MAIIDNFLDHVRYMLKNHGGPMMDRFFCVQEKQGMSGNVSEEMLSEEYLEGVVRALQRPRRGENENL